jgi:hypothetical protein
MQLGYDLNNAILFGAIAIVLLAVLGLLFVKIGNNKKKG